MQNCKCNSPIHYWLVKRLFNQHNVACHPSVLKSSLTVQRPPVPLYCKQFFYGARRALSLLKSSRISYVPWQMKMQQQRSVSLGLHKLQLPGTSNYRQTSFVALISKVQLAARKFNGCFFCLVFFVCLFFQRRCANVALLGQTGRRIF